ncbi:GNAT family N-acetyltransferase [Bacillus spongiae]|uniref:GNAT family N-acetyltransferase n=1 Tax=Bacillus spongiae TaxID=2683610 RepID=A0ABU8HCU3_9BACI
MNPILLDFPDKIESNRLYIRPCLPGDGPIVHDAIIHSAPELKKWLPFAKKEQPLEEVEENIRKSYSAFISREDIRLHIFRKSDDNFIGSTGFHRCDWEIPKVEIGYWIDTRYSGKGYMAEAVHRLTLFALDFFKANRIEIRCDDQNLASRRIPERLGYHLEGILRNDSVSVDDNNLLRNTCVFSLLSSEKDNFIINGERLFKSS